MSQHQNNNGKYKKDRDGEKKMIDYGLNLYEKSF